MTENDLPCLIKRCLTYGIVILPVQLNRILRSYELYKIPDEDLNQLGERNLSIYVKALYLCSQEESTYWSEGHKMLTALGFSEVERIEGHRCFTKLVYNKYK